MSQNKKTALFGGMTLCICLWSVSMASAATPTISSVSGTVSHGQTLTITGTTMVDHNTANWNMNGINWNFEGSSYAADGYNVPTDDNQGLCARTTSPPYAGITYDSSIRLLGNKSVRFHQSGAFSGPGVGGCYISAYPDPVPGSEFYVSAYVRYDASAGGNEWPDNFAKLFLTVGGTNQFYFQPQPAASGAPTQMLMYDNYTSTYGNIPGGAIKNNRWYYMEARYKNSSPKRYQAWVDGVQIGDWVPTGNVNSPPYFPFGMVNMSSTSPTFDMKLNVDRYAISSARIYPASMIEIGNSPTYGQGTKLWQEPIYLSDGSIQIKADLTGLGAGPYYLWVTNNRQERSTSYALSGGTGGDTTPPTSPTNLAATSPSQSSISVSWTASTDNVGVTGYIVERCQGSGCSNFAQVGTPTSSPFVDSGLTANTFYNYHVRAIDAAGNLSGWSNVVGATTQSATPAPAFTFTANPTSITSGSSSTLTWSTVTNATSCTASGGTFTGSKTTSGGTQSVSPTSTTTYTLSCTGTGGTTNRTATVTVSGGSSTLFFSEGYENTSFSSRGWYDIITGTLDTTEKYSGNSSLRCTYNSGGTSCTAPKRRKFTESNSVYIGYRVKYSANFVGSGQSYHPHEFLLLTNQNGDYDGLAFDYLTMYLESHWNSSSNGFITTGFQDGQNIDQTRINQNLIGVTENRSTAGCNGSPSGYSGDCYNRGDGVYVNGVMLNTPQTFTTGNKNTWNHVEVFYQLNTINNGIGQADGILRVWFNDSMVFERTNAILRTGAQPDMRFNQFIFGPWIGDGSPITQTMWIDDLEVRDARPGTTSTPVACNTVTPANFSQAAYNSYGAPFDPFTSNTPLLNVTCNSADIDTINLTTGITGDTTRIVYTKGYWFDSTGSAWRQYTGTCTGALNGEWCQGSVSATITDANVSTASSTNPTYLVGMTCSVQGGSWKCGCRDTTCSNFSWQVQGAGL